MNPFIGITILVAMITRWLHCLLRTICLESGHREVTWYEGITITVVACECGQTWYKESQDYQEYSKIFEECMQDDC